MKLEAIEPKSPKPDENCVQDPSRADIHCNRDVQHVPLARKGCAKRFGQTRGRIGCAREETWGNSSKLALGHK